MKFNRHSNYVRFVGVSALALSAALPALAQEESDSPRTMNTIVVTTQKSEETLQDVPIAVSAFDESSLERLNINNGSDLQFNIPNFQASQGNFTAGSIGIRGIVNAAVAASSDASVGMHVNGVPTVTTPVLETEFYDTQRIEILRGPQGTLYGRNASGGVVNVITAKPSDTFEGKVDLTLGDYNTQKLNGAVNVPLFGGVGLRLAGFSLKRDGFTEATVMPEGRTVDVDSRDLSGYRATFGGEITDRLTAYVMWDSYSEEDSRVRSAKQLCSTDDRPFPFNQGCVPYQLDGLDYARDANGNPIGARPGLGAVNNAGTLGGVLGGSLGLYSGLGVNGNEGAVVSPDLRSYLTTVLPEYEADRDFLQAEMSYELPNDMTLTISASKTDWSRSSSDDYNKGYPTIPFNVTALTPDLDGDGDGDWPGLAAFGQTTPVPTRLPAPIDRLIATDLSTITDETTSGEIRLQSGWDGKFNFNVGLIKLDSEIETNYFVFFNTAEALGVATGLPADRTYFASRSPYELDALGAFGEVYFQQSDALKWTLGLRYTSDKKSQENTPSLLLADASVAPGELNGQFQGGPLQEADFEEITGRVGFDWQLDNLSFTDTTLLYAFFSRGYKGGGINPPQSEGIEGVSNTFDPEFINSFEVGTKSTILDGAAALNLTAFYYDYSGYQISSIINRTSVNLNVDAKLAGLEAEFYAQFTDNFGMDVTFGYLNSELGDGTFLDSYDQTAGDPNWIVAKNPNTTQNCIADRATAMALAASPFAAAAALICTPDDLTATITGALAGADQATIDATLAALVPEIQDGIKVEVGGNQLPRAPETTLSIGANYTWFAGDWATTLRGDFYHQAEMYTRIFNLEADKVDSWQNANASIAFENDNLGVGLTFYVKNIFEDDQITNQYLTDASSGLYTNVFVLDPRQVGMRLSKSW